MAAYAALISVMNIIEQIQLHPHPPISLDQISIEPLVKNVTFFLDFLECYSQLISSQDAYHLLETLIANATYAVQDILESHIVDQIHGANIASDKEFYNGLKELIQEMDFIRKEVMQMKENNNMGLFLHKDSSTVDIGPLRSRLTGQNATVGFDDVMEEMMDMLTGRQSTRQIIPIVGMGGIGKTTLARNLYVSRLIVRHFDMLAWATISQEYSMKGILLEILLCIKNQESKETYSAMREDELGLVLHKTLIGRRYLIIMDDMWSIEAWELVKFFFPDNNNGSRIIVTTRLRIVASQLTDSRGIEMSFLDDHQSWNLLCRNVFGEQDCPNLELEEIGKEIAKSCKGLPLSIVVIGGLLAKSERTREYWEYVLENISSIVNLEDNERCLRILSMSYDQLSVHLKPCFLYLGSVFPEDDKIRVSWLIKLWVAEGFLKPKSGKNMELVAEEYLNDLIERNLVLVHTRGSTRNIKLCNIHDLLRDLCLRQAQKENFVCITRLHGIPQIDTHRRVCIHRMDDEEYTPQLMTNSAFQSPSITRSLIIDFKEVLPSLNTKMLRVLKSNDRALYYGETSSVEAIFRLVNLRYLAFRVDWMSISNHLSSLHFLWNLQTLIVYGAWKTKAPPEIWKMHQLRHIEFIMLDLPDPEMDGRDRNGIIVLENLQTLLQVRNFKCGEEVVKRIPNIKKLQVYYENLDDLSCYCLNNLCRLEKLESLGCLFAPEEKPIIRSYLLQNLNFPNSLKKLSLNRTCLSWEDMSVKIGSLPLLQVLKLYTDAFKGDEWETIEGQFRNLKFLLIEGCGELRCWRTESSHFPCLEQLFLRDLDELEEIPWGIGEIPTLETIVLKYCSDSAVFSAKEILEEQEGYGNVGLRVRVHFWDESELESLACPNFQVNID
ncbi:hypothetical protein ABFS83_09G056100 [Erythranthe nasuta]